MGEKTRITVLYCQHCVRKNADIASETGKNGTLAVKTAMLPCSSKIQAGQLLQILDRDADGVELVACAEDACRFLVGSRRAENRINYIKQQLKNIKVNPDRIGLSRKSGLTGKDLLQIAESRAGALK